MLNRIQWNAAIAVFVINQVRLTRQKFKSRKPSIDENNKIAIAQFRRVYALFTHKLTQALKRLAKVHFKKHSCDIHLSTCNTSFNAEASHTITATFGLRADASGTTIWPLDAGAAGLARFHILPLPLDKASLSSPNFFNSDLSEWWMLGDIPSAAHASAVESPPAIAVITRSNRALRFGDIVYPDCS